MSVSRTLRLAMLAPMAAVALPTLAAPQVAGAVTAPPAALAKVSDRSGYRPAAVAAAVTASVAVSPSGCVLKADYPHKSVHRPGTSDGVLRTKCNGHIPLVAQTAQMWETRWWGWDRIGTKGVISRFEVANVASTAWSWCKKNTVRVTGSGHVIDVDHQSYYASVTSITVKNPCQL